MAKLYAFVLVSLVLTLTPFTSKGQTSDGPETVVVHNGPLPWTTRISVIAALT